MNIAITAILLTAYLSIVFPRYVKRKYSKVLIVCPKYSYWLVVIVFINSTLGSAELFKVLEVIKVDIDKSVRILISLSYFSFLVILGVAPTFRILFKSLKH